MSLLQVKGNNANYSDEQRLSAAAEVARIWYDPENKQVWFSIDVGEKEHYLEWSFEIREFMEAVGKAIDQGLER